MTIKEIKDTAKDFPKGTEIIFPLSVFTEEEVDKLIKEGIISGASKNIMERKWEGVKD